MTDNRHMMSTYKKYIGYIKKINEKTRRMLK